MLRNFFTAGSSIPPPSGSTASIHRDTAITCLGSFVVIHTLPFRPAADSSGKRDPRNGSKKCCGSNNLCCPMHERNGKEGEQMDAQSRHFETAMYKKSPFELSEPFSLPRLGVETLELGLHVLVCQRHSSVQQGANLTKSCNYVAGSILRRTGHNSPSNLACCVLWRPQTRGRLKWLSVQSRYLPSSSHRYGPQRRPQRILGVQEHTVLSFMRRMERIHPCDAL